MWCHPMIQAAVRAIGACALLLAFVGAETNPHAVVAEWGSQRITLEEFRSAYLDVLKNPKVFDSPKVREQFLDEMITGRVLAQDAARAGRDTSELLQYKINAYRDKCLRDQHFEEVIKPKIQVREEDIEEAYLFTQEERQLSHLFFPTRQRADSAFDLLKQGADFDTLAAHLFSDPALAHSGGDLGWVEWDQLEYDLAMTAFRLSPPFVSPPVKSQFGYHILRVKDFKKKPLITRREYEIHRRKAKYLLEWKLGDKYALDYIHGMLANATVHFHPETMEFVDQKLKGQFTRKPSVTDQMSDIHLRDEEVRALELTLWDGRHEVMADINGAPFTVGEFLGALPYLPYAALYSGFKTAFEHATRDFLLTSEAKARGMGGAAPVAMKTALYREYLLQLDLRRELVRNTSASEQEARAYYQQHRKAFKGARYDQVRDFAREQVLIRKKQRVVPERFAALTTNVDIKRYMNVINEYYDAIARGERP